MKKTLINENLKIVNKKRLFVKNIKASFFRNYKNLELNLSANDIVLHGFNGIGKTNILEAVSYLTSGRGIKKAKSKEITLKNFNINKKEVFFWGISANVMSRDKIIKIGTGINEKSNSRIVKINDQFVKQSDLSKLVKISWITPQMLLVFHNGMNEKRRFIDRLVNIIHPIHVNLLYRYELLIKERVKVFNNFDHNKIWLKTIESEIVKLSIEIIKHRKNFILDMNNNFFSSDVSKEFFPNITLEIKGEAEDLLTDLGDEQFYDRLMQILETNRNIGITSFIGPHKSEVLIFKIDDKQEIKFCSTGEQKIMLISLVLKHSQLMESLFQQPPILLLDDIIEHLDCPHKMALFDKTSKYKSQCWFTCTNPDSFKKYPGSFNSIDVNKLQKDCLRKVS